MSLTRWDPFEGLSPLRDIMDQMLEESVIRPMRFGFMARTFPLDVYESSSEYVIEAMLPGLKPKDIQITAVRDRVTIHATMKPTAPADEKAEKAEKVGRYLRRERFEGAMTRVIDLPSDIDADHITAEFEHGVLSLHAPRVQAAEPKQIVIEVKEPALSN